MLSDFLGSCKYSRVLWASMNSLYIQAGRAYGAYSLYTSKRNISKRARLFFSSTSSSSLNWRRRWKKRGMIYENGAERWKQSACNCCRKIAADLPLAFYFCCFTHKLDLFPLSSRKPSATPLCMLWISYPLSSFDAWRIEVNIVCTQFHNSALPFRQQFSQKCFLGRF